MYSYNNKNKEKVRMKKVRFLTRKQLGKVTGAPIYLINYLRDCQRLPIVRESRGRGFPILYHPDCVKVIRDHMSKQIDG